MEYDELSFERFLAETENAYGKKEEEPLDYSVLSVGVLTLGLILLVEIVRHHIDHSAHGRPFFQAVLENVYSELATLGIVELFVFLLLKYYEGINKERKDVFGDVHFALFYTAILNAFQSVLVSIVTTRASSKLWVSTEHLELDHYVEIREAFDAVEMELEFAGFFTKWNPFSHTRARYLKLLVQVRFHELRLHFLEGNDLPLTLKVSDYLKRSEQRLLIQLVHISELAWLLLTGGLNLIYFIEGMVAYKTGSGRIIGQTLSGIYFSMLLIFILITVALYFKMKDIYQKILSMKHMEGSEEHEAGLKQQRALFWLGEPKLVIAVIQFMQFGYALALAIVLMYWQEFTALSPFWFLGAVVICYAIFVKVLSLVLPQYTLCTSLGHMINQKNLQETVALHRLEDEKRRLRRKKAEAHCHYPNDSMLALEDVCDVAPQEKRDSNTSLICTDDTRTESDDTTSSGDSRIHQRSDSSTDLQNQKALLAALIKSDTASLRDQLPEASREKLSNREELANRKSRMKAFAESVASMRRIPSHPLSQSDNPDASTPSRTADDVDALKKERDRRMAMRRANRKKTVSASAVIQSWRNLTDVEEEEDPKSNDVKATDDAPVMDDADALRRERERRKAMRKANRKKTVSASAVIQSWRNMANDEPMKDITIKDDSKSDNVVMDDAIALKKDRDDRMAMRRASRKKTASASEVIGSWRDLSVIEEAKVGKSKEEEEKPKPQLERRKSNSTSDIRRVFFEEAKTSEDDLDAGTKLEPAVEDENASRIAQRRASRKKALSASAVVQSWQDYSINDSPVAPRKSLDDLSAMAKSSPIITPQVLEDPGSQQLLIQNPQPIASDLRELAIPDIRETKSQESGQVVVEMPEALLMSEDHGETPLKDSDGIPLTTGKNDKEDSTVDTGKSVGELSDVDIDEDLQLSLRPNVHHDDKDWKHDLMQHLTPSGFIKDMKDFFLSDTYHTVSHVFGTLVVFFLIGQRVEAMNAATGRFDPSDNTWELRLNVSFWWQVTWYGLFLAVDLLVLVLLLPPKATSPGVLGTKRKVVVATACDVLLTGTCLVLLFVAEMQRCCDSDLDDERYLADETGFGYDFEESPGNVAAAAGIDEDCCPGWGLRTYGGLGKIEPFTSLIGLRVLRFFIAGLLVRKVTSVREEKKAEEVSTEGSEGAAGDHCKDHHDEHGGHGHGHGMHEEVGSALELWERAIGKYPDVVKRYGQFSSELFKSMLGLDIVHDPKRPTIMPHETNGADLLTQASFESEPEPKPKQSTIKLTSKQYTDLPAEVQCIIIAGRLGMPVRPKGGNMSHGAAPASELPTLCEDTEVHHHHESDPLEFEIDEARFAEEEENDSMFIAPNARLVRSMRRCHRRLLPILKDWITVDVVVTQFEIVYFEVTEDESERSDLHHLLEAGKLALKATKGGKGLRLRDVAAGRKVVGHFDLADVTEVHVERDLPLSEGAGNEENADQEEAIELETELPAEFWCDESRIKHEKCPSRDHRWTKTKEDRLTVKSIHGTLVLRYFSDLDEMEVHKEDHQPAIEGGATLKKLVAYQWAQTVVHACGQDQLKQVLPHYGEAAGEELQDYIELAHYHDDEAHKHHRKAHRRRSSLHFLESSHKASGETDRKKFFRSHSFEDKDRKTSKPRPYRRAVSSGDYDSGSRSSGALNIDFGSGRKSSPGGSFDLGSKEGHDGHDMV